MAKDKSFYSAFFTIIKQSQKYQKYGSDILIVGLLPTIISLNILSNDQMIEVIMLTIYSEYLDYINKPIECNFKFDLLPTMKTKYDAEFQIIKKSKPYIPIHQITPNNLMDTHQMLLELLYRYILQLDSLVLKQIVRMGFILCGVEVEINELKQIEYYQQESNALFKVALSERALEFLLMMISTIHSSNKDIKYTGILIELIHKKAANECKFHVSGLAQSIIEINENCFDGVF